jgi:regulator of sirC expression with transglutaminase-like and TPR domain
MNLPVANAAPKAPSEGQRTALVKLLSDEDTSVYRAVRGKILSYGQEATAWLRPHTLSSDPVLRRRAQEIVQHLARQETDNRFLSYCVSHGEDLDLEEGVWRLAQTQYPDINIAAYQALFDSFAGDLRERLAGEDRPTGILAVVNQYLFTELGFTGNQENYHDPDNSFLNRVVDRRTGNPISLCIVYLLLARRLRLPMAGIAIPSHFLCRYQSSTEALFVDAFNHGKLLTRAECIKYLQQTSHGFHESFLAPVSPCRTLLRVCTNLHQIYSHLELREEMARFQRYLVALAK